MSNMNYGGSRRPADNYSLSKDGVSGHPGPFVGIVMQAADATNAGRIRVWLKTFSDVRTKNDETSWITCRYMTPFYGVTRHEKFDEAAASDFSTNGQSYGMWMTAPDVGTEVLVVFAEGDPNQGYYIGCIPESQMNHNIPATGAVSNPTYNNKTQGEKCATAPLVPTTDLDKGTATMNNTDFLNAEKPVHSVVAGQMWKAGTLTDSIRGPITSSAQRESPSAVYGINTPGRPIIVSDGSFTGRRGGHSFVMDDGDENDKNNLLRLRTSTGHQITMSDDGETIYIAHGNGMSWVELGKEGTIDGWAANSINFRTGGDINLHADKDVNINAGEKINMYAKKDLTLETDAALSLIGKQALTAYSETKVGLRSDGTLAIDAGSNGSFKAGGNMTIKGARIGLNDGSAASVTAPTPLTQTNWADTVYSDDIGWISQDAEFKSVVSRATAHEPFNDHNGGVSDPKQPGKA